MNLRALLAAAVFLPAGAASAVDCVVADFEDSCVDATSVIEFCSAQDADGNPVDPPQTRTFDCAGLGGAGCGVVGCVGESASCVAGVIREDCVGAIGGSCLGLSPDLNVDTTDDDFAFALSCAGDATCLLVPNAADDDVVDTCVAHIGAACTKDTEPACVGNTLTFCRRFIEEEGQTEPIFAQLSNVGMDCAALGGTCNPTFAFEDNTTGPNCEFPEPVGEGEGEGEGEGDGNNNRDDEPEPAPTGCFNAFGMLPAFGPLALGLLALRRRRQS